MAESEEELKSLLMKLKEESEKTGFKVNIHKMKGGKEIAPLSEKTFFFPFSVLFPIHTF